MSLQFVTMRAKEKRKPFVVSNVVCMYDAEGFFWPGQGYKFKPSRPVYIASSMDAVISAASIMREKRSPYLSPYLETP